MTPPDDHLAGLADAATQKEAASVAQDAFTRIFRLLAAGDEAAAEIGLPIIERRAKEWAEQGATPEANTLRLALLISGMDQWGVAWSQAFELTALPGLTAMLGALRNPLDTQAAARFEQQFAAIDAREENAIDFKVELRRGIHLALWHSIVASEDDAPAQVLTQKLGSLMLALTHAMPQWGGRLLADTLAHIQIFLLNAETSSPRAESCAQHLFDALSAALPPTARDQVFAQSAQAVRAYLAARRPDATSS